MELPVLNTGGNAVDTIEVDEAVFDAPMNQTLVHQAMVIYQLNQRQGTHSTRTRAEVSGGGRKPWIQKHTGRARQGSIRSPQWRHGGIAFGPKPRDYRKALPRAMRRKALQCVLSEKVRGGRLICVDSLDSIDGKTKSMKQALENLNISGSVLVVTEEAQQSVARAGGNLKQVWTLPSDLVNANDVLKRADRPDHRRRHSPHRGTVPGSQGTAPAGRPARWRNNAHQRSPPAPHHHRKEHPAAGRGPVHLRNRPHEPTRRWSSRRWKRTSTLRSSASTSRAIMASASGTAPVSRNNPTYQKGRGHAAGWRPYRPDRRPVAKPPCCRHRELRPCP